MSSQRVSKLDAAIRQIDAAIRMLFDGGDLVAVHTLAGAGSVIASDLVEHRIPDGSWDKHGQDVSGLKRQDYFRIIRATQNFLKHAKTDPDDVHELSFDETVAIIMNAVMNLGLLVEKLSAEQSVFQLWYFACDLSTAPDEFRPVIKALFKDLSRRTPTYRVSVGLRILQDQFAGRLKERPGVAEALHALPAGYVQALAGRADAK